MRRSFIAEISPEFSLEYTEDIGKKSGGPDMSTLKLKLPSMMVVLDVEEANALHENLELVISMMEGEK